MAEPATESTEVTRPDESPFSVPPVSSGYPLEKEEEAAIRRILDQNSRDRTGEAESA